MKTPGQRLGGVPSILLVVRGSISREAPILILDDWDLELLQMLLMNALTGGLETVPK